MRQVISRGLIFFFFFFCKRIRKKIAHFFCTVLQAKSFKSFGMWAKDAVTQHTSKCVHWRCFRELLIRGGKQVSFKKERKRERETEKLNQTFSGSY